MTIAFFGVALATSGAGCASVVVPVGEWSRPVDLVLNNESLKGVRVAVRCGRPGPRGELVEGGIGICGSLALALEQAGAEIVPALGLERPSEDGAPPRASAPDYELTFTELGSVESSVSVYSQAAFTFSNGLLSWVSSSASEAEMSLRDNKGSLLERSPMRIEEVQVFGLSALVARVRNPGVSERRSFAAAEAFYDFARNRIRSRVVGRELALRRERGVSR